MQNTQTHITELELQHWVHFLTHIANYKVSIFERDTEFNITTTDELLANARKIIDRHYAGGITGAEAYDCAINYRYDDDCVYEGIEEQWEDYCEQHGLAG